eukprot:TRINITY_DN15624_c0_g1_i1.p1 TRINITY_DN15624_c0_g1~~TRINITY_DN15624_c0_g1_i1.p1  ORF type:complete len:461 (+),score=55.26 TRINITY_DN15624_c0_g1_i1:54-1436(+)
MPSDPPALRLKRPSDGGGGVIKLTMNGGNGVKPVRIPSLGESSGGSSSGSFEGGKNMCIPTAGCGNNVFALGEDGVERGKLREVAQCIPTKAVNKGRHQHLNVRKPPGGKPISFKDLHLSREPIGKGGQGQVRKAYHPDSKTYFAMKEIFYKSGSSPLQSIQRELERVLVKERTDAETIRQLEKYTVQNYEAYWLEQRGKVCILMEWMENGSLNDVLKRLGGVTDYPPRDGNRPVHVDAERPLMPDYYVDCDPEEGNSVQTATLDDAKGRFSMADISFIAFSVLSGLAQLQHLGLVHNDIKPDNILVGRNGEVKIADFGVAKWTDSISVAGSGAGSTYYMAPERVLGKEYSYQADVYSLGIALAHCAVGRYPLVSHANKMFEVLQAIAKGRALIRYPPEIGVDPDFQDFTWQCMTPNWTERPTARSLLGHPFITKYQELRGAEYRPEFIAAIGKHKEKGS